MAPRPVHNQLIHCAACGEDYSATYRKCPFCGARNDPRKASVPAAPVPPAGGEDDFDDGYVFDGQELFDGEPEEESLPARGGKRLAGGQKEAGGSGNLPNWPRVITFLCSIIIIIAAIIIVITYLPERQNDNPGGSSPNPGNTQQPAASDPVAESDPVVDPSEAPSDEMPSSEPPVDATEPPVDTTDPPADATEPVSGGLKGFTTNTSGKDEDGFALRSGESFQLRLTFDPVDWSGEVTYSISDERYATVNAKGYVTNVNPDSVTRNVTLTITAGDITVTMPVYCYGSAAANPSPSPSAEPAPSDQPSGGVTVGGKGTIVNAPGGLRVRSGPGTNYEVVASLVNGDSVTVVANAGDGWYQISFPGIGGVITTGYIKGDYLSTP